MKQQSFAKRVAVSALVATLAAFGLAACGSPNAEEAGDADSGELTTVNVGNLTYVGTAPFQLGIEQGFFEEEGLHIEQVEGDNPAALAGQVTSGQLDIAFTTTPFLATAVFEGADLRAIAPVDGVIDPETPASAALVSADSDIESMADLSGKQVAIPALGSLLHLVTLANIDADGGDSSTVELVQIPFPQMQQALETGNVDAIITTEPFFSATLETGARMIGMPEVEVVPNASVTAWAASLSWIEENTETVAAFDRAMARSLEYAAENSDALLEIMPEYTGLEPEQIDNMNFGTILDPKLNTESIADMADLLVEYGFIESAPALEDLVYEPGS